jgi:glycosyltransferase involved in cell wall biosynthesis
MRYRNEPPELLLVIGSENPGWGEWRGIVDDETLNLAYNSVDFFLFPSVFSSIGLPVLESCVAKTIPICCNDDLCLQEFIDPILLPRDIKQISAALDNKDWVEQSKNWVNSKSDEFKQRFNGKQIAQNILNLV